MLTCKYPLPQPQDARERQLRLCDAEKGEPLRGREGIDGNTTHATAIDDTPVPQELLELLSCLDAPHPHAAVPAASEACSISTAGGNQRAICREAHAVDL